MQFVWVLMQMNWIAWTDSIELWLLFLIWILFQVEDQAVLILQIGVAETL